MSCGKPHETPCSEVLREMAAYLDGELTEERRLRIGVHLEECGPCLEEYGLEREVKVLIARCCAGEHAPPAVRLRIEDKLRKLFGDTAKMELRPE